MLSRLQLTPQHRKPDPRGEMTCYGGLVLAQQCVRRLRIAPQIDAALPLFKRHLPCHESDHVLALAYTLYANGTCLDQPRFWATQRAMARVNGRAYYERRRARLLRGFDRFARYVEPRLARRYDAALAVAILADARVEFARLIPELPYIGGLRNIFTPVMMANGWIISLHRAMRAHGQSVEDAVRVCAEVSDEAIRSVPAFFLRLAGRLALSLPARALFRRQAARSQRREYAEDFVYRVRETEDGEMTLVFDECAVNKFYAAQHVEELKPYCNFFDVTYSRLMDMGCDATETIGLGCRQCSLRYKHRRATPIPARLQGILPHTTG